MEILAVLVFQSKSSTAKGFGLICFKNNSFTYYQVEILSLRSEHCFEGKLSFYLAHCTRHPDLLNS